MAIVARLLLCVTALFMAAAPPRSADAAEALQLVEHKIKAGLIYNFLKYTEWPRAGSTTIVCLFGGDPFDGHLAPMAGRTVNQHTIEIQAVDATGFAPCAVLVVHVAQKAAWPEVKKTLAGKDILTVADFDSFAADGGMIEFARIDSRIGIKLNAEAIAAARLKVHERLQKLATIVRNPPGAK